MSKMYERIQQLCKDKGVTVSQMCRELKITRSCLSELSQGRTETLSAVNTGKIARYFGVSASYLTDGEQDASDDLKFAVFNCTDGITDEMFEEVKRFAEMVRLREESKRKASE